MQLPQSLNPWLVSYIQQHYPTKSRYEIDKYLIEAGYDPAEIELVWQFMAQSPLENKISNQYFVLRLIFTVIGMIAIIIPLAIAFPHVIITILNTSFILMCLYFVISEKLNKKQSKASTKEVKYFGKFNYLAMGYFIVTFIFYFLNSLLSFFPK